MTLTYVKQKKAIIKKYQYIKLYKTDFHTNKDVLANFPQAQQCSINVSLFQITRLKPLGYGLINSFLSNSSYFYPLKTSENRKVLNMDIYE